MKLHHILVLSVFLPFAAAAQEGTVATSEPAETETVPYGSVAAADVTLEQFLWVKRPLVVFADTPNDPNFQRQMQRINAELGPLEDRHVVVIVDSDPAQNSSVRQRLRPRGFSLVLMDMDGEVKRRVPSPWHVREITHAIDRFPLRREELRSPRS